MTDTLIEPRFARVRGSDDAPAVFNPGWLPDAEAFPDLNEARAKYLRLQDAWQAAAERRRDIEGKLEDDQQRRELALRDAYLGEQEAQLEPESETLLTELEEAKAQGHAAQRAFVEHINQCIALVIERREAWLASIEEFQHGVDAQVEELLAQAARLRTQRGMFSRLEHWIQRTAVDAAEMPAWHFPYSEIAAPPSGDVREQEARATQMMLRAYGDGIALVPPASDEQGQELERQVLEGHSGEPVAAVELSELEDDELVDWLMSTGRFDGNAKPNAELVVLAAEGDPAMAGRLLKAERTANESGPRQAVIDQLGRIGGGR
jgi:hypothetical protein